ncbi:MAG: hypothetical protein ABR587_14800 [Candidatus Binatia bacterium]
MSLGPFQPHARDLAPGDYSVLEAPWEAFTVASLRCGTANDFDEVFRRLWREFGERGEMERREVIEDRLSWDPRQPIRNQHLLYELIVVRRDGEIVAIRDHTAIVPAATLEGSGPARVVVHLSHVLVEPSMRGRGLASWLRALPVETARRCLALARSARTGHAGIEAKQPGCDAGQPFITLVAEMEHDDGETPVAGARLRSYAKAGFRLVDPEKIDYLQPDFRSASEIERSGLRPVPLCLVVRRVGREQEAAIPWEELRGSVDALQSMFAVHVRADHMVPLSPTTMPPPGRRIALLVPGEPGRAGVVRGE